MKQKKKGYTKLRILSRDEKQEILKKLKQQFGVKDIPGIVVQRGKERLFFFSGSFSESEIKSIEKTIPIERVGAYFAKLVLSAEEESKVRLSIEGTQILKEQITKNIFELSHEQMEKWMRGEELQIETGKKGFLAMKYNGDFLGCGKASEKKITNFIPKNRRIKDKN